MPSSLGGKVTTLDGKLEWTKDYAERIGKYYAFQLKDGRIFVKPYERQSKRHIQNLYASANVMDVVENIKASSIERAIKKAKKEIENV